MKKSAIFGLAAIALLSLAACNKETDFAPSPSEITVTATSDGATRTAVQSNGKSVWWSPADKIDVFCGPGDTPAVFTGQNTEAAATASFKGELQVTEGRKFYGIYPSSNYSSIDEDGNATVYLKPSQKAVAGTFGPDIFPAVAVSDNTTLSFRSVAGGVKFSVAEESITSVVLRGNHGEQIAGVANVNTRDGSINSTESEDGYFITVTAPDGGFKKGEVYYAIMLPTLLKDGITIVLKNASTAVASITTGKSLEVKRGVIANIGVLGETQEPEGPVERVWGKYTTKSSSLTYWNDYLGSSVGSDRNVTMDDNYIYIAESNKTKNLWALNISDGSLAKKLPTSTVKEEGTFWLSCPRVINLDSTPTLTVCSMSEDVWEVPVYLYVYENGIDSEPTAIALTAWLGGRMGDTFTFWGAGATNSADGQGLTKGLLYFDDMFNSDGIRIWKTTWNKGGLPEAKQPQVRYGFDNANTCQGAFWPYPANKDAGIWGGRNYDAQSVYGSVKAGAPNLWSAEGDQLANTVATPIEDGYYKSVPSYQFFDFGGKRYIAYAKQVSNTDGRVIIMQGATTDSWEDIMSAHNVIYQASMQADVEFFDGDWHPEMDVSCPGEGSTHQAMDLCIRVMDDCVYIVCIKEGAGLSLFKLK